MGLAYLMLLSVDVRDQMSEVFYGSFIRTFTIPSPVDAEQVNVRVWRMIEEKGGCHFGIAPFFFVAYVRGVIFPYSAMPFALIKYDNKVFYSVCPGFSPMGDKETKILDFLGNASPVIKYHP